MASTAAKIAKEKGNVAFKAGNFEDAVGHYSAAFMADRKDPTYPLNRAAAYLKLGKHRDAERDCTTVLSIDSKNVKALFRRAQARKALENLAEAEKDLVDALKVESTNDTIKQELAIVRKRRLEITDKRTSGERERMTVSPVVSHPFKSGAKNVVPQLNRIIRDVPIEIVESDQPPAVATLVSSTSFLKPIQSRVFSPSSAPRTAPSSPPAASPPQPRVGASIFHAQGKHSIIQEPVVPSSPYPATVRSPPPAIAVLQTSTPAQAFPTSSSLLTHFTFSRAWHALPTPQERYDLLLRIPPKSLSTLFQTSLEPALLVSVLRTFVVMLSPTNLHEIAEYMSAFPAVPRFATVVLFFSAEERTLAREVWDTLGEGDHRSRREWGV